jgi:hypothetical protein
MQVALQVGQWQMKLFATRWQHHQQYQDVITNERMNA